MERDGFLSVVIYCMGIGKLVTAKFGAVFILIFLLNLNSHVPYFMPNSITHFTIDD